MESNIFDELYKESKIAIKLTHIGLQTILYLVMLLVLPIACLVILFVPIIGWWFYPMIVYGCWIVFRDAKSIYKLREYRFGKVFILKDEINLQAKDEFFALMRDGEIMNVMHVIEISKNKNLRRLLVAQLNPKNELLSVNMSEEEFYKYHTGEVLTRGIQNELRSF